MVKGVGRIETFKFYGNSNTAVGAFFDCRVHIGDQHLPALFFQRRTYQRGKLLHLFWILGAYMGDQVGFWHVNRP